jgi:hypothetical protein
VWQEQQQATATATTATSSTAGSKQQITATTTAHGASNKHTEFMPQFGLFHCYAAVWPFSLDWLPYLPRVQKKRSRESDRKSAQNVEL